MLILVCAVIFAGIVLFYFSIGKKYFDRIKSNDCEDESKLKLDEVNQRLTNLEIATNAIVKRTNAISQYLAPPEGQQSTILSPSVPLTGTDSPVVIPQKLQNKKETSKVVVEIEKETSKSNLVDKSKDQKETSKIIVENDDNIINEDLKDLSNNIIKKEDPKHISINEDDNEDDEDKNEFDVGEHVQQMADKMD